MTTQIDANKVTGVVHECQQALQGRYFHVVEVMVGLSELIGRTIVESGENPIQMRDMAKVAGEHLDRTITAGIRAKGWGPQE